MKLQYVNFQTFCARNYKFLEESSVGMLPGKKYTSEIKLFFGNSMLAQKSKHLNQHPYSFGKKKKKFDKSHVIWNS